MVNINWDVEDAEFYPKRKVNNRGSWRRAHIIGTFYSAKMRREIEYESLNEFIFYSFLELDAKTIRYYIQPIEISIYSSNTDMSNKIWTQVPDVLVFRENIQPTIYQIKDVNHIENDRFESISKACYKYAKNRKWEYKVVYPKQLPKNLIDNVRFLFGFLKERKGYDKWVCKLIEKVEGLGRISIRQLSESIYPSANPLEIIPVIYHLIAKGVFYIELKEYISSDTEVTLSRNDNADAYFSLYEGSNYEQQ